MIRMDKIMGFCEKVCYFFVQNFLFALCNLPVLLFLFFVGAHQIRTCLPLFLLCMVPMAPALSAVFYSMNRLIRGIESGPLRDFKKGYRQDFCQKTVMGCFQMLFIFVLWTNVEFFAVQMKNIPLTVIFGILFAVAVLITPYLYMLLSRYEMKNLKVLQAALTLMFVKPVLTLGSVAVLGLVLMAFELSPGTCVLFAGSVYGFLIMFMNRRTMQELEEKNSTES